MALFIDSSDPKEIKDLFAWGVLSGRHDEPAHHRARRRRTPTSASASARSSR